MQPSLAGAPLSVGGPTCARPHVAQAGRELWRGHYPGERIEVRVPSEPNAAIESNASPGASCALLVPRPFNDFVEEKQEGLNSYEERRSL